MVSNRTNPPPHIYTAALTSNAITRAEQVQLMQCVKTWPGTNDANLKSLVSGDISRATPTG